MRARSSKLTAIVDDDDPFVGPPSKGGHGPKADGKGRRTDCVCLLWDERPDQQATSVVSMATTAEIPTPTAIFRCHRCHRRSSI
jgi:hypothetical protein